MEGQTVLKCMKRLRSPRKELCDLKKKQKETWEWKNTVTERKTSLGGLSSSSEMTEEPVGFNADQQSLDRRKQRKEIKDIKEQSFISLWEDTKKF